MQKEILKEMQKEMEPSFGKECESGRNFVQIMHEPEPDSSSELSDDADYCEYYLVPIPPKQPCIAHRPVFSEWLYENMEAVQHLYTVSQSILSTQIEVSVGVTTQQQVLDTPAFIRFARFLYRKSY